MKHNYDTVAGFYDRLSRLIFGRVQVEAQVYLLKAVTAGSRILIVGGGTGWILEEIAKLHSSGLTIVYVDSSEKMIRRSEKRNFGNNNVAFLPASIETTETGDQFDVVITPFLFDNFTEEAAIRIFSTIDGRLRSGGTWLYCDFQNTQTTKHRVILTMMYTFFRLCSGIKAKRLPDMSSCFKAGHYVKSELRTFMNGFIISEVYKKS